MGFGGPTVAEGPVFLIGMMGAGKSTVGLALAQALGWNFTDIDQLIQRQAGMSIPDLFGRYGEAHFRQLEAGVLREQLGQSNKIVACGGGIVLHKENRRLLKDHFTVYLETTVETLCKRLEGSQDRPLLTRSETNLKETVFSLLSEREPDYREVASMTVNGDNEPAVIAASILKALQES